MRARHPRGIRARLLTTNAVVMLLALVVLIGGSNAILRRSLDRDATNLVRARAAAGLATLRVSADRLKVVESPDDAAIDVQIWVFDQHGAVEGPTPSTPLLDRKAAELTRRAADDDRRRRHPPACRPRGTEREACGHARRGRRPPCL